MNLDKYMQWIGPIGVLAMMVFLWTILAGMLMDNREKSVCAYEWEDTGFRVPVERLSDEEANAYYDGRKLVNDNQRNYIDIQAGRPVRSEGWSE